MHDNAGLGWCQLAGDHLLGVLFPLPQRRAEPASVDKGRETTMEWGLGRAGLAMVFEIAEVAGGGMGIMERDSRRRDRRVRGRRGRS